MPSTAMNTGPIPNATVFEWLNNTSMNSGVNVAVYGTWNVYDQHIQQGTQRL